MEERIRTVTKHGTKFWAEFKEFAIRGNMLELAIGVIIGTAFNGIINSLVKDVIMPPFGLVLNNVDFTNLFIDLSGRDYPTLAAAQAAGVPTINYGIFLNQVINFVVMALVVFVIVKQINRLRRQDEADAPKEKDCPFCLSAIPIPATRCPHCTSTLSS
ncbi:MAG: large conductance mechanosensitive channel protein MscL [Candidatus Andersenbacteria bacterium]